MAASLLLGILATGKSLRADDRKLSWLRATARRIASEIEWSPPTHAGIAPAASTSPTAASIRP